MDKKIESFQPLVSVGIPTYNRPDGLKRTLECILAQTYTNLEILVSDNASPNPEVEKIAREFASRDSRIIYYRQEENKGAVFNFKFVLKQAHGKFFMWAADDDYFATTDLISKLVSTAQENNCLLVFPNVNIVNKENSQTQKNVMTNVFKNCETDRDYIAAWCGYGKGYPIYGLFDLSKKFLYYSNNRFDEDFAYYNEGPMLHRAFLYGGVRFVENVSINYTINGQVSPQTKPVLLLTFIRYTYRLLLIYVSSGLPWADKIEMLAILLKKHIKSMKTLFAQTVKYYQNLVLHRTVE